jgi:hypothetical protein
MRQNEGVLLVTEIEGVDRSVLLNDPGTWRLLLAQLRRDAGGDSEWFVLACVVKSVLHDGGHPDGVRARHQSRRTEPFLRRWRGAMNHWASRNCDVLKDSYRRRGSDLTPGWRSVGDCVTPGSPARPELSLPVLRALTPPSDLRRGLLSTL